MDRFAAYRRCGGGGAVDATCLVSAAGSYCRAEAPDEAQIPRCPRDETKSQTVPMTATIECMFTLC